ncbi:hypothetical protein M0R45_023087 [Rubus argutus]|uniref:Bifunctional inhibitor/plant lipid transfer protein/seed storage helical domain-containing protein n=1 Tax=Rubus argutus TaxID=59490 RepID=A0AAW1WMH7_RUBAR
MKASYIAAISLFTVVLMMLAKAEVTMAAVTCSPVELSSCANAISSDTPPTKLCCTKLKEQKPCLCQYLNNPNLKKFVNTPNARKVARTCGTPFPRECEIATPANQPEQEENMGNVNYCLSP